MPHKCTKCGKIYPDGDYRILNGCECGNNKFLYVPKERLAESITIHRETEKEIEPKTESEKKDEIKIEDFEGIQNHRTGNV